MYRRQISRWTEYFLCPRIPTTVSAENAEHVQRTVFASSQEALALTEEIHGHMQNKNKTLDEMSKYYFDGQGKAVRPALTLIMASACNSHLKVNCKLHSCVHQIRMGLGWLI